MEQAYDTLATGTVRANQRKIEKRELTPSRIEISLYGWDNHPDHIGLNLIFSEKDKSDVSRRISQTIDFSPNSTPEERAAEYDFLKGKLERGEYKIIHYGDGQLEVEWNS